MPRTTTIIKIFDECVGGDLMSPNSTLDQMRKLPECFEYVTDDEYVVGIKRDYVCVKNRYLLHTLKEKQVKKIIDVFLNNVAYCYLTDRIRYPSFKQLIGKLIYPWRT